VKQELEKNIQSLRAQIGKYDTDYNKNLEVLGGLTDSLMNLLKNVRTTRARCPISYRSLHVMCLTCLAHRFCPLR
jgi:hypothetical protein